MNMNNTFISLTVAATLLLAMVQPCLAEVGAEENFRVGLELLKENKLDEAITQFKKAVAKEPSRAEFHSRLAQAYSRKMMFEEAVKSYTRCLELDPDNVQAHNNLGVIYDAMDLLNEAIAE